MLMVSGEPERAKMAAKPPFFASTFEIIIVSIVTSISTLLQLQEQGLYFVDDNLLIGGIS